MRERSTPPDLRETELRSELQQAVASKNYDRVIELAQTLKSLSQPQQSAAEVSPSPKRDISSGNSPTKDKYERFVALGLREFKEDERPLFLQLDINAPTAVGSTRKTLTVTQSKQAAFILFSGDANSGYLYPNPRISFTEAMKYVWPELSYSNWPQNSHDVQAVRVTKSGEGYG